MWLFIVLLSHFFNAVAFLIDKHLLIKKVPRPAAYSFTIGALGVLAFVLAPWGFGSLPASLIFWSLFSGAAFIVALYFFFSALKADDASRVVPFVGGIQPIIIFLLAYLFLGERLSGFQILSGALLVSGGILISLERRKKEWSFGKGILYSLFAGVFFAISFASIKGVYSSASFLNGFLWSRLGGILAALSFLLFPALRAEIWKGFHNTENKKEAGSLFLGSQVAGALGFLLLNYALSLGSVTLTNALQGVQYVLLFIFVAILSKKFPKILKEKFSSELIVIKVIAIVLIVGGLAILAL